ncbi:hypothetical protein AAG906_027900 [Vitis piasezkii]
MRNSMSVGKDTWKPLMFVLIMVLIHGYWGWDELNQGEVGKTKSQPNAFNAKAGMYTLNEDIDMKAKVAAMTRRLEELELKKIHGSSHVLFVNLMSTWWRSALQFQLLGKLIRLMEPSKFLRKPRAPQYTQPAQPSQQASNLEQAIVNLSKRRGDFLLNLIKTPRVSMKWKLMRKIFTKNRKCPVVISSSLTTPEEMCLLEVLKKCKKAIGWQIFDLKGISPLVYTRHIYMEEEAKPIRQPQRRMNPHMQEVVRAKVLKLLQVGIIYPISDSPWVSPTQVVPKKSGITVVQNEKEKKLLHASLLVGEPEKTTFTCPFGTYAYRRMPFGLCNAPATFQRCMLTVLNRCIEKDLVLNWEKCHFMVQQGIVLGHIISKKGIEVDKAKVELIVKLPSPTTVKGVRQFLSHAGSCSGPKRRWKALCDLLCKQDIERSSKELHNHRERIVSVVFVLDKFRAYLVGSFIIVFTDHSALKYILTKQDAKARLIRWILLLQEFNLQIRDKKGMENVVTDHLSSEWKAQDRKHFFAKIHAYYWEEPFLFKYCADQITRKCVPEEEQQGILSHCHESAYGGHFASQKTAMKVVVLKFLKENIFSKFGVPKAIINDGGTHFRNKPFETLLAKYGLHDSLWAYRTTYKTILSMSPYHLVYGKACHLPMEVEYKAWWAIKKLKSRWTGPFIIHQVHLNGVVELLNSNSTDTFKVNGHRLKPFMDPFNQDKEEGLDGLGLAKVKEALREPKELKSKEIFLACKNFTAKIAPLRKGAFSEIISHQRTPSAKLRSCCETCPPLQNHFTTSRPPSVKPFLGTRVSFRSPNHPSTLYETILQLRNTPLAHECHFVAPHSHFVATKWLVKSPLGCEIPFIFEMSLLREKLNLICSAKTPIKCEIELNHNTISKGIPRDLRLKQSPRAPSATLSQPSPSQSWLKQEEPRPHLHQPVIIRRPMVTQPPIEGNLDCRARPFHFELCFDRETFRLQPELRDSFHLLQRYHLEHLMTPRDYFYPRVALDFYQSMTTHRVWDPTIIHFTIDGRHGILGARHIAKALHIPYEPARPHEEAAESGCHSTSIPEAEIPTDIRAPPPAMPSTGPMPKVASSTPPATPGTPPVVPTTSEPHPFKSSIVISISEFRGLCHTLQTLTATQSILTQQMVAIRVHQDQLITTQTYRLCPEEPITGEIKASIPSTQTSTTEPSSPHDPPTTI